jgi:hypothetical protein
MPESAPILVLSTPMVESVRFEVGCFSGPLEQLAKESIKTPKKIKRMFFSNGRQKPSLSERKKPSRGNGTASNDCLPYEK